MTESLESTIAMDARLLTRRRREQRIDHVLEVNMHERADLDCPACGHEWTAGYHGPIESMSPSFSPCSDWDCDAYLKVVHDGSDPEPDPVSEAEHEDPDQTALGQFDGGAA
ncbi:hypothetical protein [Halostagnicola kamekurae]|nr:hypothetical protein [Halostagnicola kamekurae]